jgi:hypothetical protein
LIRVHPRPFAANNVFSGLLQPQHRHRIACKPVEVTTEATFAARGVYWLRAIASDGMLETNHDVKVTVTAPAR